MSEITLEMFRQTASDPTAWREKAVTLRAAAQSLWDSFKSLLLANPSHLKSAEEVTAIFRHCSERIHTSQLLYGLATETALKARIIQSDPGSITFQEKIDGDGNIVDLTIQKIGAKLSTDGHNLVQLAEVAGVLDPANTKLFPVESDFVATREILIYLTHCVRWSGRYPAPKKLSEWYVKPNPIPQRALGLYLRDWLDPFLDNLLTES